MRTFLWSVVVLVGCIGGSDQGVCPALAVILRDPVINACHVVAGCELTDGHLAWNEGDCVSGCTGLSETACLATAGCQVARVFDSAVAMERFQACWAIPPAGPPAGACSGLGAQDCARRDDCSAVYVEVADGGGMMFARCADELLEAPSA